MMPKPLRVVSLLPGLTDTLLALGVGETICGISHECDLPSGWPELPRLTRCRIDDSKSSKAIDEDVRSHNGTDLYDLDSELLASLRPDLILTQAQCDVCAISEKTVARAAASLPGNPAVLAVHPIDLGGVCQMIREVGARLDRSKSASELIGLFDKLKQECNSEVINQQSLNVAHLEWLDPPMSSGHWNHELFQMARLNEITGAAAKPSVVLNDRELRSLLDESEKIFLGICGFSVDRTLHELNILLPENTLSVALQNDRKEVFAIDAHRLMVRPGPLLLTSVLAIRRCCFGSDETLLPDQFGQLPLRPQAGDVAWLEWTNGRWCIAESAGESK